MSDRSFFFVDLSPVDRAQLALALDLLARRLRSDGLQPSAALRSMRHSLSRTDLNRLEPTNRTIGAERVDDGPVLYDIAEVADRLRLNARSVERLIATGELPSLSIGRARRVRPSDLVEFIAATGRTVGAGHVASARTDTASQEGAA